MNVPAEIVFSPIRGGYFEATGRWSGEWWKGGRLIATWRREAGKAVVTWTND